MNYPNSAAFRRALEDRLRRQSLTTGVPLIRLRKTVAFERFLARLAAEQPDRWVLKGGLALQLRLGERARTTQDIDLLLRDALEISNIHQALVKAALLDLGDWFSFEVARPEGVTARRYAVRSLVDGRPFESFHVDVGIGDPLVEAVEILPLPSLLEFAGISATAFPCYPISQQIAEKVHAYTRPYTAGESTRVKDWVDILLLAQFGSLHAAILRQALTVTFEQRGTHPLPTFLPHPPASWARTFQRLARQTELGYHTLAEAIAAMQKFIDPLLQGQAEGTWDPASWQWQ